MLLTCQANVLLMYYLFLFGWMVVGGYIFWGYSLPNGYCNYDFGSYVWSLLIISFIMIPIQLIGTRIRGKDRI